MKRRGFTLIELLVVIAILAVLMGVLLPSLSAARRRGQATKCLAALHEMGTALAAYFQTNEDRFPLSQAHGGYQPGTAWIDTLSPHTESKLQYRCPTDPSTNFEHADPAQRRVTSYGVNVFMGPNSTDWFPGNPSGIPPYGYEISTRIGDTSKFIYVAELAELDANGNAVYADHLHPDMWGLNPFTGYGGLEPKYEVALERHLMRSNFVFADSHAAALPFDQTWRLNGPNKDVDRWDPGFPHSPEGWYKPEF